LVLPPHICRAVDQRISLRCSCSSLGWETASSSSTNSWIWCMESCVFSWPCAFLWFLALVFFYCTRLDQIHIWPRLPCTAGHGVGIIASSCSFSLACLWLLVWLSCPWAKGDTLDSDSSNDLMSGASGGTNGDQERWTMNTSRVWSVLLLMPVPILSELLTTSVEASVSQIESPS
jgi:hypothetical protein